MRPAAQRVFGRAEDQYLVPSNPKSGSWPLAGCGVLSTTVALRRSLKSMSWHAQDAWLGRVYQLQGTSAGRLGAPHTPACPPVSQPIRTPLFERGQTQFGVVGPAANNKYSPLRIESSQKSNREHEQCLFTPDRGERGRRMAAAWPLEHRIGTLYCSEPEIRSNADV